MPPRKQKPIPTPEELSLKKFQQDVRDAEKVNLKDLLVNHVCQVTFEKVDGTKRVMRCTLKKDLLPPPEETNTDEPKKEEKKEFLTTIPVYDLDKSAWRSFRVDSVIDAVILE